VPHSPRPSLSTPVTNPCHFSPHLTLARVPEDMGIEERSRLADLVAAYKLPPLPSISISEVALMQSFLLPGGARYEQRAAFPLKSA